MNFGIPADPIEDAMKQKVHGKEMPRSMISLLSYFVVRYFVLRDTSGDSSKQKDAHGGYASNLEAIDRDERRPQGPLKNRFLGPGALLYINHYFWKSLKI